MDRQDRAQVDVEFGVYRTGTFSRYPTGITTLRSVIPIIRGSGRVGEALEKRTRIYRAALAAADPRHRDYVKSSKRGKFEALTVSACPVKSPWNEWLPREDAAEPTGLYGFDVDHVEPGAAIELRTALADEEWCRAAWVTVSGEGVYVVVDGPMPSGDTHQALKESFLRHWLALCEEHIDPFFDEMGEVDHAPTNIASLRFVSHDADAVLSEK